MLSSSIQNTTIWPSKSKSKAIGLEIQKLLNIDQLTRIMLSALD